MHARVARFEGGDPERVRQMIEEINRRAQSGPPEGVPANSLMVLHDPDEGRVVFISTFETKEDLERGHATLNAMDPPTVPGAMGRRTAVELYEVPISIHA